MTSYQTCLLLLGLAAMVLLARLLGALARRLGQPAVIGEVLAGIAMGPTLFHGAVSGVLFPAETRSMFDGLAAIGVVVFMFLIGLEWDASVIRGSGALPPTVAAASIALPFALGVLLGLFLLDDYVGGDRTAFALFIGIAMSITAFPVLVRILTDRGIAGTRLGVAAVACAAIDDVLAWSLLAVVVAVTGVGGADQWHILLAAPYLLAMLFVVRPALRRLTARATSARLTPAVLTALLVGLLLSAAATEWMGLHYIFGAFLFGIVVPREGTERLRQEVHARLEPLVTKLLLPVFFLVAGLSVDLSGVGLSGLGALALILLVAVGGKFLGAFGAARLNRMPTRQAAALGALMNTRGLTELIVLNVGLGLGFIGPELYSLMVVMAVATTAMTGPILTWLIGRPDAARADDGTTHEDAGGTARAGDDGRAGEVLVSGAAEKSRASAGRPGG